MYLFFEYKLIFCFPRVEHTPHRHTPIDLTVLRGILHDRKYTHSPVKGICYVAIRCFTKELHRDDNYFTIFVISALQPNNR